MLKKFVFAFVFVLLLAGVAGAETMPCSKPYGEPFSIPYWEMKYIFDKKMDDSKINTELTSGDLLEKSSVPVFDKASYLLCLKYAYEKANKEYSLEMKFTDKGRYDFDINIGLRLSVGIYGVLKEDELDYYTNPITHLAQKIEFTCLWSGQPIEVIMNDFFDLIAKYGNSGKTEYEIVTVLDFDSFIKGYSGEKTIDAILDTGGE